VSAPSNERSSSFSKGEIIGNSNLLVKGPEPLSLRIRSRQMTIALSITTAVKQYKVVESKKLSQWREFVSQPEGLGLKSRHLELEGKALDVFLQPTKWPLDPCGMKQQFDDNSNNH